ncbi:uncharacterized mitochondrial protein AtMg00810-like [Juglans microcarpa x Juglans regia]|uniref:uncharacterized mitochondrial protein AtMg00810-like n=1 Tax=Juglans microcarpa x Juglans regia TaxID=2249226 RepID=UPI001B7DE79C|nr:uncharacterized mitochondrial protein AtMg00810-like [Juglans microcarpa x Juglans regia]
MAHQASSSTASSSVPGLSPDLSQKLLDLLSPSNPSANFVGNVSYNLSSPQGQTWIIDSGASHHMCHDRTLFFALSSPSHASKDPQSTMLIGAAELCNGLYMYRPQPITALSTQTLANKILWHQRLDFHQSQADHSLFTIITHTSITIVLVYVDDILVAGNDISQIDVFKSILSTHFKTKDLNSLKYFLSLEVARYQKGIFLNQRKYTLDILTNSGQLGARTAHFPIEQNLKLTNRDGSLLADLGAYRRLVGSLIYLNITRPDIIFAVNILSQFMHAPRDPHMQAAIHVLRYLKGSPGQGIFFSLSSTLHVTTYTDSDWVSCPTTRRSTTGFFIQLGMSPISWCTKNRRQQCSSAKAEYRVMEVTTCELT